MPWVEMTAFKPLGCRAAQAGPVSDAYGCSQPEIRKDDTFVNHNFYRSP